MILTLLRALLALIPRFAPAQPVKGTSTMLSIVAKLFGGSSLESSVNQILAWVSSGKLTEDEGLALIQSLGSAFLAEFPTSPFARYANQAVVAAKAVADWDAANPVPAAA